MSITWQNEPGSRWASLKRRALRLRNHARYMLELWLVKGEAHGDKRMADQLRAYERWLVAGDVIAGLVVASLGLALLWLAWWVV